MHRIEARPLSIEPWSTRPESTSTGTLRMSCESRTRPDRWTKWRNGWVRDLPYQADHIGVEEPVGGESSDTA